MKRQLFSYYYIRQTFLKDKSRGTDKFRRMIETLTQGIELGYAYFLDSGGFTFQDTQAKVIRDFVVESGLLTPAEVVGKTQDQLVALLNEHKVSMKGALPVAREYFEEYLDFVHSYGHLFTIIAELDIEYCFDGEGGTVTLEQVDEWANQLFATSSGQRVMPTYRSGRGRKWLRDWLMDTSSPYVAIGSGGQEFRSNNNEINLIHRAGKWVHGFGLGQAMLKTNLALPFDSVDASSVGGRSIVAWRRDDGITRMLPIGEFFEEVASYCTTAKIGLHTEAYPGGETLSLVRRGNEYRMEWQPLHSVSAHLVSKPCYKLTFETGQSLEVTGDHSLFSMTPAGELIEVKPEALQERDWVVAPARLPWGGQGITHFDCEIPLLGNGGRLLETIPFCLELDEDVLTFFGLWVAEGSYNRRTGVWVTNESAECQELVWRIANRYQTDGNTARLYEGCDTPGRQSGESVCFNSLTLPVAMQQLGLKGGAENKELPWWFWSLTEKQACWFLKGMFSGDGGIDQTGYKTVNYYTVSTALAAATQTALLSLLGGPVTWHQDKPGAGMNYPKQVISMSEQTVKRAFMERIGFMQVWRMGTVFEECGSPRKQLIYGLPVSLARTIIPRPDGQQYVRPNVERVGRWALEAAPDAFHPTVASPDVIYLRISKIEHLPDEPRMMYDLSVPGAEIFYSNGVLPHNTWLRADKYGGSFLLYEVIDTVSPEAGSRLLGTGRAIKILTHKEKFRREAFASFYKTYGLDIKKIRGDDPYPTNVSEKLDPAGRVIKHTLVGAQTKESLEENRKATIIAWREIARYYEENVPHRLPYLWKMCMEGRMPDEHPLITAVKAGKDISKWL